jgi:hypothetical protein
MTRTNALAAVGIVLAASVAACSYLVDADRSKVSDGLYQPTPKEAGPEASAEAGPPEDGSMGDGAPEDGSGGDGTTTDGNAGEAGGDGGSGGDANGDAAPADASAG